MKQTVFTGVATALITPFNESGVDYDRLRDLINWQIDSGINALVICGTTGESSTMTDEEHRQVIAFSAEVIAGRVPLIAGADSNDTAYAAELIKHSASVGADAMLVVTPYYNKATQKGLIQMYTTLAEASDKPIIIYNVPSRTGVNVAPSTYAALADHPNIVGIKEANGNISSVVETMALTGGKLDMYSGNDDQIVPIMSMGGKGVISVLSNIMPAQTVELCNSFFAGNVARAAELQCRYNALIGALFSEVNPIPVKAAMSHLGWCENRLRMPLTPMDPVLEARMLELMRAEGLEV